jgi:hypothetical protein
VMLNHSGSDPAGSRTPDDGLPRRPARR